MYKARIFPLSQDETCRHRDGRQATKRGVSDSNNSKSSVERGHRLVMQAAWSNPIRMAMCSSVFVAALCQQASHTSCCPDLGKNRTAAAGAGNWEHCFAAQLRGKRAGWLPSLGDGEWDSSAGTPSKGQSVTHPPTYGAVSATADRARFDGSTREQDHDRT